MPPVSLSATDWTWADSTISESEADLPFGVPSRKSPIVGLTYASDGRFRMERAVADGRPHVADVFDAAGRCVAVAEWPRAIDMYIGHPFITGRAVTTVETDANGVEREVRPRFQ